MPSTQIRTVEELHRSLHLAMRLEHATIPPYLVALYSIHPGTNSDATHILRACMVEQMLHLTLAANILNAVGGTPDLTASDFAPRYPMDWPAGEESFDVNLQRFSREAVETFLKIEDPPTAPEAASWRRNPHSPYDSTADLYAEIRRGLAYLAETAGPGKLFSGSPAKQATSEYYYSGGGELFPVTDLETATMAIDLISAPRADGGGDINDRQGNLANYYRLEQLKYGRYYESGDRPHEPAGRALEVDWDACYPVETNPRAEDYRDSELYAAAADFNRSYAQFLALLTRAYSSDPQLLLDAIPQMFRLREKITRLIHTPVPGRSGVNAAPTFELADRQGNVWR